MTDHRVRLKVFTRRWGQGQWRGVGGLGTLVLVNVFVRVLGKPRVGAEGVGEPFAVASSRVGDGFGNEGGRCGMCEKSETSETCETSEKMMKMSMQTALNSV